MPESKSFTALLTELQILRLSPDTSDSDLILWLQQNLDDIEEAIHVAALDEQERKCS